jgi:geranylgeranyl diphosphate synthase type II
MNNEPTPQPTIGINDILQLIENRLSETRFGDRPETLYEPIRYLMDLGGKRLRPALVLLTSQLFAPIENSWVGSALGVEVFHNFTLMHDDIMDNAPLRRGKPTVHQQWNPNVAILSGDVMFVCAYNLMHSVEDKLLREVLLQFNKVAAEVCEGQQWDMDFEKQDDVTEDQYLEMIRLKTAVLLGYSCRLGGILSETDANNQSLLAAFGTEIGIGFQLMDDILDVYGDQTKFGKQVGGDIVANKKTYLLIKAKELAKQHPAIDLALNNAISTNAEDKVSVVTSIYNQLGIRELSEAKMKAHYQTGIAMLDQLNGVNPDGKQILLDFVEDLMKRGR